MPIYCTVTKHSTCGRSTQGYLKAALPRGCNRWICVFNALWKRSSSDHGAGKGEVLLPALTSTFKLGQVCSWRRRPGVRCPASGFCAKMALGGFPVSCAIFHRSSSDRGHAPLDKDPQIPHVNEPRRSLCLLLVALSHEWQCIPAGAMLCCQQEQDHC